MTASVKTLLAASAITLCAAAPAFADYTILEDTSLPSVLFVEFGDTEPKVIEAPASTIPVEETEAEVDPALPPADDVASAPLKSVEERIEERMKELEEGAATQEAMPEAPALIEETATEPASEEIQEEVADTFVEEMGVEEVPAEPVTGDDFLIDAELK